MYKGAVNMKIINRIKGTILSIKDSAKRFPITVAISTILTILLIYLNESTLAWESLKNIQRIASVVGLGIPLSLCIGLLIEKFFKKDRTISSILYLAGTGFLVLYYFTLLKDYNTVSMSRYFATMLFLILAIHYISRIKNNEDYEYYVIDIYSAFALTFIYSFVLYFGIAAILFTINQLFDIRINGEVYYYMFLIVTFIFGISLFLSKLPALNENYRNVEFTKSLRVLLVNIVIPLITVYTAILYVYFGKILITREWPSGLVSHLVLWYSTVSVGIIFLITPILEKSKPAKLFKTLFPKLILPVLFMMFMSIYQRINQYGITENRYYLVVLGLWVLGIMLYFTFAKKSKNIIIPITLSIVMLNSVYGPLSSFAISKYSQNNRLENLLEKNNIISGGNIVANSNVPLEDKKQINSIIKYFKENHELKNIKTLPKDFDLDNMTTVIGFKYEDYYDEWEPNKYFHYNVYQENYFIDISGYEYYVTMNSWGENNINIEGLVLKYNNSSNLLTITRDDRILLEQDMAYFLEDIHAKHGLQDNRKGNMDLSYDDATYEISIRDDLSNIDLKFIFKQINGRIEDEKFVIEGTEFIILINNK